MSVHVLTVGSVIEVDGEPWEIAEVLDVEPIKLALRCRGGLEVAEVYLFSDREEAGQLARDRQEAEIERNPEELVRIVGDACILAWLKGDSCGAPGCNSYDGYYSWLASMVTDPDPGDWGSIDGCWRDAEDSAGRSIGVAVYTYREQTGGNNEG